MKHLDLLTQFAKGKDDSNKPHQSRNAVIYTRVSSKEQAETNQSLEVQKKYCLQYALKHDLNILGFFGGTYESAKTDEREEFNRMIRFVKNQHEGVSTILVYSLDRFSRTGDNASFISSELKRSGITITSVTQPIDVSKHSGVLQQNIQFIFSKYDNDLRREKCIAGMKEKLLRGEWVGCAPIGYFYDKNVARKEQKISLNEKGTLIRKAFEMKSRGTSNSEIAHQLKQWGLPVNRKRFSEILRNPFYCGFLSHSLLEGRVVKGKHEAVVSEELFLQANDMLKKNASGYKAEQKNIHIPLKNFVRCASCGTPMTGYLVKKKQLHYYKCNKIRCCSNRSAKVMHESFVNLMNSYQLNAALIEPLRDQLLINYEDFTKSNAESHTITKSRLKELQTKLTTLEERFAYGEIDRVFSKK
jgi:site-specific DNA recombinase